MPSPIPTATLATLCDRYEAVFLDAYGVLVNSHTALPGAAAAIAYLNTRGLPWLVLTNDASRLPETNARRLRALGIELHASQVLSSGELLAPYFSRQRLRGARCVVLGSGDSAAFVVEAGGVLIAPSLAEALDVLVVCDDRGYPFLETVSEVLSMLFAAVDQGRSPALLLPNPDLIYPHSDGRYGFTAGTVALMFEQALALRYPERSDLRFVRLGKPYPPIFEEGMRRVGTRKVVMIGDQLATDIAGARAAGIDSALVCSGLARAEDAERSATPPTWLLDAW